MQHKQSYAQLSAGIPKPQSNVVTTAPYHILLLAHLLNRAQDHTDMATLELVLHAKHCIQTFPEWRSLQRPGMTLSTHCLQQHCWMSLPHWGCQHLTDRHSMQDFRIQIRNYERCLKKKHQQPIQEPKVIQHVENGDSLTATQTVLKH